MTQSGVRFRKISLAALCVEDRLEAEGDEYGVEGVAAIVQGRDAMCWPGRWQTRWARGVGAGLSDI